MQGNRVCDEMEMEYGAQQKEMNQKFWDWPKKW